MSLHPEYYSMRTFVMSIYAKRVTQITENAMLLLQEFGKIETLLLSKHAKHITEENALTHRCKNNCSSNFHSFFGNENSNLVNFPTLKKYIKF